MPSHTRSSTIAQQLAAWVTTLRYDDLPDDVTETVQRLVLDQVGLQIRGATLAHVQPVIRVAETLAGRPESTVTGTTWRTTAPHAAWVNGTLGHSAEYDDAHALAWHVSSTVVSAALTVGETTHATGRDLITAVAAGHQVMALLGAVTGAGMQSAGWHGSKVLGVFGAAAAAAYLLGLSAADLVNAFGIAGSDAGGTMEYDQSGGEVKRLHAGSAARIGVESAYLAQAGFTGPSTIFEGHRGIFPMFGSTESASALDAAWDHWHIRDTMFRLYPAVATIHSPIAATAAMVAEHDIDWRDVTEVSVGVAEMTVEHGGSITHPHDGISAQFSLAFSLALALVRRQNQPADYFDEAAWNDPQLASVADRVRISAMEIPPADPIFSSTVTIALTDGQTFTHYERAFPGHFTNPATLDQITVKFHTNVDAIIGTDAARRLQRTIELLHLHGDVGEVTQLLAGQQ